MAKPAEILRKFKAKDGREVILRVPDWGDVDDMLVLINSLVDEGASIVHSRKVTREEEVDWLGKTLISVEKGDSIAVCAEVEGTIVASSGLSIRSGIRDHTGEVGLIVRRDHRDLGIGTAIMETLVKWGREMGLELVVLGVFEGNDRARHVYEKLGFREVGRIPREFHRDGRYFDHVRMVLEL